VIPHLAPGFILESSKPSPLLVLCEGMCHGLPTTAGTWLGGFGKKTFYVYTSLLLLTLYHSSHATPTTAQANLVDTRMQTRPGRGSIRPFLGKVRHSSLPL